MTTPHSGQGTFSRDDADFFFLRLDDEAEATGDGVDADAPELDADVDCE
jgi:hypothetical protein